MSLPSIHDSIHASSLYPDQITIRYAYSILGASGFPAEITHALEEAGLAFAPRGRRALRGAVDLGSGGMAQAYITRPAPNAPLSVYFTFSPLSVINRRIGGTREDRSRRQASNWLPSADVAEDNNWVAEEVSTILIQLESRAYDYACAIGTSLGRSVTVEPVGIFLAKVELAIDIAAPDPAALVKLAAPVFLRRFTKPAEHVYKAAAIVESSGSGSMLSGFDRNVRFKLYEQGTARIRLEAQLGKDTLGQFGRRITIAQDAEEGERTFPELFAMIATSIAPRLEAIRGEMLTAIPEGRSPLDLAMTIANSVRRPEVAVDLLRILVRREGIESAYDHVVIARLKRAGVLTASSRGWSVLSDQFRAAARILRNADDLFGEAEATP